MPRPSNEPMSHISSLANLMVDFCIQMVDPYELKGACDLSSDLRHDMGMTMENDFVTLLDKKHSNCTDWFLSNLAMLGIQEPLVVIIRSDGYWQMDEGHHRLQWALLNNVDVPVIFDDSGYDDDSHMGFLVARENVVADHMTTEDTAMVEELVVETEQYLTTAAEIIATLPVAPRKKKNQGRHRAA